MKINTFFSTILDNKILDIILEHDHGVSGVFRIGFNLIQPWQERPS